VEDTTRHELAKFRGSSRKELAYLDGELRVSSMAFTVGFLDLVSRDPEGGL